MPNGPYDKPHDLLEGLADRAYLRLSHSLPNEGLEDYA